jgi:hypothetical protein
VRKGGRRGYRHDSHDAADAAAVDGERQPGLAHDRKSHGCRRDFQTVRCPRRRRRPSNEVG